MVVAANDEVGDADDFCDSTPIPCGAFSQILRIGIATFHASLDDRIVKVRRVFL